MRGSPSRWKSPTNRIRRCCQTWEATELERLNQLAAEAASSQGAVDASLLAQSHAVDAFWTTGADGKAVGGSEITKSGAGAGHRRLLPQMVETIDSGAQIWQSGDQLYIAGSAPAKAGTLYIGRQLPDDFLARYADAQAQNDQIPSSRSRICARTSAKFCWR